MFVHVSQFTMVLIVGLLWAEHDALASQHHVRYIVATLKARDQVTSVISDGVDEWLHVLGKWLGPQLLSKSYEVFPAYILS